MATETVANDLTKLIGSWDKTTRSACSQAYPDRINFKAGGIYAGENRQTGTFTIWDAGSYELVGAKALKISTANDAEVIYRFDLSGDVITFVDPTQCQFSYRRARG